MAKKPKTVYVCQECGYESPRWMGKCICGAWNTMVEEPKREKKSSAATRSRAFVATESDARPLTLGEISLTAENRFSIGLAEVDRLLGSVLSGQLREDGFLMF